LVGCGFVGTGVGEERFVACSLDWRVALGSVGIAVGVRVTGVRFRVNVEAVGCTDVADGMTAVGDAVTPRLVIDGVIDVVGADRHFAPRTDVSRFSRAFGRIRSASWSSCVQEPEAMIGRIPAARAARRMIARSRYSFAFISVAPFYPQDAQADKM
jgi:hypothetical protein